MTILELLVPKPCELTLNWTNPNDKLMFFSGHKLRRFITTLIPESSPAVGGAVHMLN